VEAHTYTYKSVPGCDINVDVYPATGRGALPAVVFIHGGCLMYGSRQEIDLRQLELYVEAGFTTLSIDYRLAPETGLPDIIEIG
jgi:acetyl esterase/lipase